MHVLPALEVEDVILVCQAGYYRSGWYCVECPLGTYSSSVESTSCESCPTGSSTSYTGSTASSDCGKYKKSYRGQGSSDPEFKFMIEWRYTAQYDLYNRALLEGHPWVSIQPIAYIGPWKVNLGSWDPWGKKWDLAISPQSKLGS